MAQTVIGIFDSNAQAETAAEMLAVNGLSREKIDISVPDATRGRGDVTDEVNTLNSSIGRYFQRVFADANQALRYAAVAQQGAVVAVQSDTLPEAERIADILDQCGAINVDERARTLEDSWTRDDRTRKPEDSRAPEVRTYPGIAEHEQPSGTRVERAVTPGVRQDSEEMGEEVRSQESGVRSQEPGVRRLRSVII